MAQAIAEGLNSLMNRIWAVGVVLVGLSGCSSPVLLDIKPEPDFATAFTKLAEPGFVDMAFDIENPTDQPVTLTAGFLATDASGATLDDVTVTSAYGVAEGRLVLMPGRNVDFLQIDGLDAGLVEDIELIKVEHTVVDVPVPPEYVEALPIGGDGEQLDYDVEAVAARLTNPNDVEVHLRLLLLVLGNPPPGEPQQAVLVHDITDIDVAAGETLDVPLDEETRTLLLERGVENFVSLRAVPAPPR
jgi:hypothetical protein